jgi:hypothetical protein
VLLSVLDRDGLAKLVAWANQEGGLELQIESLEGRQMSNLFILVLRRSLSASSRQCEPYKPRRKGPGQTEGRLDHWGASQGYR